MDNRHEAKDAERGEPDARSDQLAFSVIGAALDVHRALGPGFLESVYEEALAIELRHRSIPFSRQFPIAVTYRGQPIGVTRLDFLVGDILIVELKAVESLAPIHVAQVLSYLKATGNQLALLVNFNVPELRRGIRRIIRSMNEGVPRNAEREE